MPTCPVCGAPTVQRGPLFACTTTNCPANWTRPQVTHEPRCNTHCTPGTHHLTDGIGYPHLHRTDLGRVCGECANQPKETP